MVIVIAVVISCNKNASSGPLCAQGIKPTPTYTPTPDSPYTVLLHEEATPMAGVSVVLSQPTAGITLNGTTDANGKYIFNVHKGGQWKLTTGNYDGFEGQSFDVEPLANTFNSINYGIPSLEVQLVSGSEQIPMAASTIVYKVIYHTNFSRPVIVNDLAIPKLSITNSLKNLRDEGDCFTNTIQIPKSFEDYLDNDTLEIVCSCHPLSGITTYAPKRVLYKNWAIGVTADFIYAAVKAYNDNNGRTSYYAGIKNISVYVGTYIPHGNIVCEIDSAANTGDAGTGSLVLKGYGCFDNKVDYGCYDLLAKLKTDKDEDYAYSHDNNNGTLIVRIHDDTDGDLDVERAFFTNIGWSMPCYWWCCTSNTITPQKNTCTYDKIPFPKCGLWDSFRIAFAYRERTEKITSYKK